MPEYDEYTYNPTSVGSGGIHELPSQGLHQAVCCQVHNLGFQEYQGNVSLSPKICLIFELDQKMAEGPSKGKPFVISETFLYYLGEKAKLRTFVESWRFLPTHATQGRMQPHELVAGGFSIKNFLGKCATLNIAHKPKQKGGGMKAYIASISMRDTSLPKVEVTYLETPKWVIDDKAKAVEPPRQQMSLDAPLQTEDQLPF